MGALRLVAGRRWLPVSYTDEQREEAAELLSMWASDSVLPEDVKDALGNLYAGSFQSDTPARVLAVEAFFATPYKGTSTEQIAEAESWVRCGWSPEDGGCP